MGLAEYSGCLCKRLIMISISNPAIRSIQGSIVQNAEDSKNSPAWSISRKCKRHHRPFHVETNKTMDLGTDARQKPQKLKLTTNHQLPCQLLYSFPQNKRNGVICREFRVNPPGIKCVDGAILHSRSKLNQYRTCAV